MFTYLNNDVKNNINDVTLNLVFDNQQIYISKIL